jgi:hypothetical protein
MTKRLTDETDRDPVRDAIDSAAYDVASDIRSLISEMIDEYHETDEWRGPSPAPEKYEKSLTVAIAAALRARPPAAWSGVCPPIGAR